MSDFSTRKNRKNKLQAMVSDQVFEEIEAIRVARKTPPSMSTFLLEIINDWLEMQKAGKKIPDDKRIALIQHGIKKLADEARKIGMEIEFEDRRGQISRKGRQGGKDAEGSK